MLFGRPADVKKSNCLAFTLQRALQSLRGVAFIASLAFALLLSGCSTEPPPVPPTELQATTNEVQVLRLWSSKAGDAGRGLFEPYLIDDKIVVANAEGRITSFAKDSGIRQWRTDLDVTLTSGVGGAEERLYVSDSNAQVHALSLVDGSSLWQARASSEVLKPVVEAYGVAVLRSADGRVAALEPADGQERWTVSNAPPALSLNGYSRPLLLDGGVLIGLDDGRLQALNLNNGKLIWESVLSVPSGRSEIERLVDIDADLVIDDEGIYVANYQGRAAKLEPARGQVVWSEPLSAGSGIALDDTGLIVVDEDDVVHRFDKDSGQKIWSNDTMTGRRFSPPAFTPDGNVLLGDVEGYIHVLDAGNGEVLGRTRLTDSAIQARPLRMDETVFVLARDGVLAAYRFAR